MQAGRGTSHELNVLKRHPKMAQSTSSKSISVNDYVPMPEERLHVGRVVCAFQEFWARL